MAWRLARSLETLRDEANNAAPGRSKVSDGTIGDPSHSRRTSDHNPDAYGVVTALDLTHDPSNGADMHVWAEAVRVSGHPALKYIIWNRRISNVSIQNGAWRAYSGSNPHTSHMHVSVGEPNVYDDTSPWGLEGDDMPSLQEIEAAAYGASYRAIVRALRQATGPDDASRPAGVWFREVLGTIRDIDEQTANASAIDYKKLAAALLDEWTRRQNG